MRKIIGIIAIGFLSGIAGTYSYNQWMFPKELDQFVEYRTIKDPYQSLTQIQNVKLPLVMDSDPAMREDFVSASAKATQSVVYIKSISSRSYGNTFFDLLFSERGRDIPWEEKDL